MANSVSGMSRSPERGGKRNLILRLQALDSPCSGARGALWMRLAQVYSQPDKHTTWTTREETHGPAKPGGPAPCAGVALSALRRPRAALHGMGRRRCADHHHVARPGAYRPRFRRPGAGACGRLPHHLPGHHRTRPLAMEPRPLGRVPAGLLCRAGACPAGRPGARARALGGHVHGRRHRHACRSQYIARPHLASGGQRHRTRAAPARHRAHRGLCG
ncbi:hypothetical protein D3C81_1465820 [compost metagenome]